MKILCSFGGKIEVGPSDGNLVYVGGTTKVIRISDNTSWQQLREKTMAIYKQPHTIKYQLPEEDLDALVSVFCDEDLQLMMEFGVVGGNTRSEKLFSMFLFAGDSVGPPNVEVQQSDTSSVSAKAEVASADDKGALQVKKPIVKVGEKLRPTVSENEVLDVGTRMGRAGITGFGKAVGFMDTLLSRMTGLRGGFVAGVATKGNKIYILAFEVANTIVRGANLMQSLSKENIQRLKEVVLHSKGVQLLISKDMDELLRIAAADKREELKIFAGVVVRFGNRCKDPRWHNLDRYFAKLESGFSPRKRLREEAAGMMQNLMTMVHYTTDLYHELCALDRFEQDYQQKLYEEESLSAFQKGDNLHILRQELKSQIKHVTSLKKKSLWCKTFEEVLEKLVDIVQVLHLEIHDAFGSADGGKPVRKSINSHQKLGSAGLALHYANIINQIDTLVSRSSSVPPNSRDTLYQGLPPSVKSALRSTLPSFQLKENLTVTQIKAEMEKTLQWLVPMANNTTKGYHGFGWVEEWANTGNEVSWKPAGQSDLIRIETLHHADKDKTEYYILDLVVWLHLLVLRSRAGSAGMRSPVKSSILSPSQKRTTSPLYTNKPVYPPSTLTQEEKDMLRDVSLRRLTPGLSKSQEFDTAKMRLSNSTAKMRLSKSQEFDTAKMRPSNGNSHFSISESTKELLLSARRPTIMLSIDFDIHRINA